MKVVHEPQYVADDGKSFSTEAECLAYEEAERKRLANITYWKIYSGFDCTEGRGFGSGTLVQLSFKDMAKEYMLDYCFKRLGSPVCYVQGVSPARNWTLTEITKEEFDAGMDVYIGSSKRAAGKIKLSISQKNNGHDFIDQPIA
jgi:hypothetical protein